LCNICCLFCCCWGNNCQWNIKISFMKKGLDKILLLYWKFCDTMKLDRRFGQSWVIYDNFYYFSCIKNNILFPWELLWSHYTVFVVTALFRFTFTYSIVVSLFASSYIFIIIETFFSI
jgi:hypothetical protein